MRAIEHRAIVTGTVTGRVLMERAGEAAIRAMLDWRADHATPGHALILCGPGNNGGDGFVIARLLKERGWEVELFLYGCSPTRIAALPPDAAANAGSWQEIGEIRPLDPGLEQRMQASAPLPDVIIDALFGTGLTRPLSDRLSMLLAELDMGIDKARSARVAIDSPSGLCMDSGRVLGPGERSILPADLTVSFHRPKLGHFLADGPALCGLLRVVDIGLPEGEGAVRLAGVQSAMLDKSPRQKGRAHKYDHGHALILSGGSGKGGAARLAARGSLRIGAGLVTLGCPPSAMFENAAALDAVMVEAFSSAKEVAAFIPARKVRAVCIGPGFGRGLRLREYLMQVSSQGRESTDYHGEIDRQSGPSMVVDADALSEYADDPETLFEMLHERCVLTPHEGEFARLFPDLHARLAANPSIGPAYSKLDATCEAASRAGCVVLFKGADTVIADPTGRAVISGAAYARAAPWLATAGTGDVLAGFITGLLARGLRPFMAAEAATWLHLEAALQFGPGLIAEDLPEQLPELFRKLGF